MPFTPFHLGPGAMFKAIGGDRFSFMIFGGSQVVMDIEPLLRMVRGDAVLHGASHTLAGALVIALVSAAVGRPVSQTMLRLAGVTAWRIGWTAAAVSAFIGSYSHIVLDAIMHRDMLPFWPLSHANPLLGVVSVRGLHAICLAAGALGITFLGMRALRDG